MHAHPETFLSLDELGSRTRPYVPTYAFPGPFIDEAHEALSRCPVKDGLLIQMRRHRWPGGVIPGWLMRADALKLYELAYYASAPILELGSYHGLSTAILARASHNSSNRQPVHTVDRDWICTWATVYTLWALGLQRHAKATTAEALSVVERYAAAGTRFGFVFVDHSHEYEPVNAVCQRLEQIIRPGGFCLFHDFNDSRNRDPADRNYGVYQAVQDGLDHSKFEFYGIYGCTGLYRAVG